MARLEPIIHGLNPSGVTTFADGQTVTNAEIINIFDNLRFTITDASFGINRGRAVAQVGTEYRDQFNAGDLLGYAHANYTMNEGMHFIILHEIAHVTLAGQAVDHMYNDNYVHRTGDIYFDYYASNPNLAGAASGEFLANEKWANNAAKALGTTIGVPTASIVTFEF